LFSGTQAPLFSFRPRLSPRTRLAGRIVAGLCAILVGAGSGRAHAQATQVRDLRALLDGDGWRDGLAAARRWAAQAPDDPEAVGLLGEALYRAGEIEEAETLLAPLAERGAAAARALLALGLIRNAQGREEEAGRLVDRAFEKDPADRIIAFRGSGAAATSARAIELLQAYSGMSQGDDPDRARAAGESLRFLRALAGRRVWIPVSVPEKMEAPLRALGGGGSVRGYVVEVGLGEGKPVRMLLDTGSSGVFLLERIARRHGFTPLADSTTFGGGGDQRHDTSRGILPRFSLGSLAFREALVLTTAEEIEPTGQFHGVLGIQCLEGYRITLDLARGRLLLDAPPENPAGQPYWEISGQLLSRAGAPSGRRGLFALDTGAARSVVSLAFVSEVPGASVGRTAAVRGYGGRLGGARSVRGMILGFQGAQISADLATDLALQSRLSGVEISGFLGLDLLSSARLVVDTRWRRVLLETATRR